MSKEIRENIDKLKNWKQVLREGIKKNEGVHFNKIMKFKKPNFDFEWNEAQRYPEFKNMGKDGWIELAQNGFIVMYSEIKDVLGNVDLDFDTLDIDKKNRFKKAIRVGKMELPIVVKFNNESYDLIGGNTRLSGLVNMGVDSPLWVVDLFKTTSVEYLNEQDNVENIFSDKLKCIKNTLEQELNKYDDENYDDRWIDIRQILRKISGYFEDGYFMADKDDNENKLNNFLKNLNYSNKHTYKMGEQTGILPDSNIVIYRATGDKTLFRGVSLKDWERIKSQGYIDSDMRGAILDSEGINLAQNPDTALYYLPHNKEGIIMAISPKNLDLYMLFDEYIRVFDVIPIENVIKISDVFIKNKLGSTLTTNTEKKINDIVDKIKTLNVSVDC